MMTNLNPKSNRKTKAKRHIYSIYFLFGSLMCYIRNICAAIVQQQMATTEAETDETDADVDTNENGNVNVDMEMEVIADTETDARTMMMGICIIRLITLKRFLEISSSTHKRKTNINDNNDDKDDENEDDKDDEEMEKENDKHNHWQSAKRRHQLYTHPQSCWRHQLTPSTMIMLLLLLSSHWPDCCQCLQGGSNTVKTKYGLLRGIVVRSTPSPLVEAFLGIPYASPPVGSLRFMPPITPSTWKTVRSADRFSPVCPQNVPIPPNGPEALLELPRSRLAQLRRLLPLLKNQSEDCLYLNIYVPYETQRLRRYTSERPNQEADSTTSEDSAEDSSPKLSTVVFIHGESYDWNSGNPYDGSELAAHGNVIVVTINFRLGIFGFLKTGGKESAQGNFGLMDLVAGLHWLKENLPAFGGDPQSITLLGYGTGAVLANILAVSPVASDLIQRTVLISGSALSPWAIQKNPLFVKRRVAEQTGCHGDMLYDDLAPCLRTKSVAELLAVKIDHPRFLVGFAPFVDGTVISPGANPMGSTTLPMGSAIVSTSGIEYANFPKRDLIFCLTSVESYLDLSAQDLEFGFNETRRDRILRTFVRNNFHYHLNEIFAVLKNEYTDWEKAIRNPLSSRDATLQFLSDGHTASPLIKLGYMHSLRGGRTYFLHFKHKTIEEEYPQRTGSVRGEDVPFWLGLPVSPLFPHNYTTQEHQIGRLMLRYLSNFAKTGNPNQSTANAPLPQQELSRDATVATSHQLKKRSTVHASGASEAMSLAVLYNQRRSNAMHEKRAYVRRRLRSNDAGSGVFTQLGLGNVGDTGSYDGDELPFWDAYDVVNQLYVELGNKANIQSHYRGHKLSMWLNLIPQLHRHFNINDQSMRHHQFQDDMNNRDLYEGVVRPQLQIKPADDDNILIIQTSRTTTPPPVPSKNQSPNATQAVNAGTTGLTTTECNIDGAMSVSELTTTQAPIGNRTGQTTRLENQKDLATASTGIIGNLELLRRLSGKQFQSYTTALIATVAVGCFLLILNVLIFAGIYHQREKRARDAKTKEELQEGETSKNSSVLKLNGDGSDAYTLSGAVVDSKSGGSGAVGGVGVIFGEYSCYDEKTKQMKEEKLLVELPPASTSTAGQTSLMMDNWGPCSTSTLDLLKTKPIEMVTYNPLPTVIETTSGLSSKRGSFVLDPGMQFPSPQQFDYAVQSSDQMSFKAIEEAVKAGVTSEADIMRDDGIPEPPPPPRSFLAAQQQQQQQQHQQQTGILRQTTSGGGTVPSSGTSGGKKRVHIQEISV
ncbi:neuroligin-1 [Drosophila tropicalis]|uniref:neuroligin-1 n=1 Tax=Drosophila tropicalis TaxID=46794 RepID=UPI0035ABE2FC